MSDVYDPAAIEPKWQEKWEADGLYRAKVDWDKPKHYALTMLPYPSGDLHIGHWFAMTPSDARARYHAHAAASTFYSRWASTPSACRRKTPPCSVVFTPQTWTYANIRADAGPVAQHGCDVRLAARGREL
jgi:leucyl-tRNA synthetase